MHTTQGKASLEALLRAFPWAEVHTEVTRFGPTSECSFGTGTGLLVRHRLAFPEPVDALEVGRALGVFIDQRGDVAHNAAAVFLPGRKVDGVTVWEGATNRSTWGGIVEVQTWRRAHSRTVKRLGRYWPTAQRDHRRCVHFTRTREGDLEVGLFG